MQNNTAWCTICKREYSYKGSTSNLRRHCISEHNALWRYFSVTPDSKQTLLEEIALRPLKGERQYCITRKIGEMILFDLQPFKIVEDVGFLNLIQYLEPRYKVPSQITFSTKIIPEIYDEV